MYSDDDPYLTELRDVCLAFPESCEVEAWGRPTFRAGKKMFAVFSGTEDRPWGVIFKPEPDERPALLQDGRFYVPRVLRSRRMARARLRRPRARRLG